MDPTALHIPLDQSNFLLGCFCVSLIQGDNILGLNLKSSTIKEYMKAAADLYPQRSRDLERPFQHPSLEVDYPLVLIKALKKYEEVPNRREVITDSMFCHIDNLAHKYHVDSLHEAFKDWAAVSRYAGQRRSEWCQTTKTKFETVPDGPEDEALAFRADDITFYDESGRLLDINRVPFSRVAYAQLRWRYQKNGENGEAIKYHADESDTKWCICKALWNIAHRAIRLNIPTNEPVAKYRDEKGKVFFITDSQVNKILQDAAKVMLNIKDEKVISRWTTHSLRVTAANELHRLGFSDAFIKHRLRWKSDAFLQYLRHTIHVARNHTNAMRLSKKNLTLGESNLKSVNDRANSIKLLRTPGADDILWEQYFFAAAA